MALNLDPREENFRRLATLRVNNVMEGLRKVGNLANPAAYKWSDEEVMRMFRELRTRLTEAEARFHARKKKNFRL